MQAHPGRPQRGFTLLELMVAVGVFAVMGAIAYQGLGAMARNAAATTVAAERYAEVTRAVAFLERDVRGAVPRPVRDILGGPAPPLAGNREALTLTRSGWDNPLDAPRATLQRVSWLRQGDELIRLGWPVLDLAQGTEPLRQAMLKGVETLDVEFLPDAEGEWINVWPPPTPTSGLVTDEPWPAAVRIRLEVEDFGAIERLFVLVEARP